MKLDLLSIFKLIKFVIFGSKTILLSPEISDKIFDNTTLDMKEFYNREILPLQNKQEVKRLQLLENLKLTLLLILLAILFIIACDTIDIIYLGKINHILGRNNPDLMTDLTVVIVLGMIILSFCIIIYNSLYVKSFNKDVS